jgi:hypothetical protein
VEAEERADGVRDDVEASVPATVENPGQQTRPPDADGRAEHERCRHHPGRAAVGRCSACGEPVCLSCAVPVRGRIFGPECLAKELGDPALTAPPEPERSVPGAGWSLAGAALAVLATVGPWTRAGTGARVLGAWVPSFRWSMVAAVASLALLGLAWWFRSSGSDVPRALIAIVGVLVTAASALAIVFPPTFQVASWGPWAAALGGAVATGGAIASGAVERRPSQGGV